MNRTDLGAGSWFDLVERFVSDPVAELEVLEHDTRWQQAEVLRYDRYVPERRLSAGLRSDRSRLLRQTEMHLSSRYGVEWAGVAAILYRDGADFQGLHSDRALRWLDDTLIAIVVLGERRPFVIRRRGSWQQAAVEKIPAGSDPDDIVVRPGDGDLLVMGGAFQRDWLHGVPAADTSRPRISLTWRWTSRRGAPDTNPGYAEGRQFSDRAPTAGTRFRPPNRHR